MVSTIDKLADLLRDGELTPYDVHVKKLLQKPDVLRLLWNKHRLAPEIGIGLRETHSPEAITANDMAFVGEEYREEQATYRADIVVTAGHNKLLHVEQQTKHSRTDMLERLAKYALLISAFYDFDIQLFQMYYYTGPDRVKWFDKTLPAARVNNANWALSSRFLFINSGDHDADGMLSSENFSYATLGLLARNISSRFVRDLIALGHSQLGHDSHRWRDELATCITVASLRGREREVWQVLEEDDKKFLSRNGWWLSAPMIEELYKWRSIGNVQIMMDLRDLEDLTGERFQREFMQWAVHNLSFDEVDTL
ncbi:hypothetical protein [Rhizobium leguminosarum]|uniref:hypothetical protein n=1 Tax=Rhizobium leguminosarum TaxID=384 RepID=UPI001C954FA9|nr:hypothetical protein [Rhizobium leguminosarum]MBY5645858.1 hypothetical protein [Rhizobium leguminosarum]